MDIEERRAQGEKLLNEMLGSEGAAKTRETWAGICPDFERYIMEFLAGEIWNRPGLDLRTRSLVTIAVLAAQGRTLGLDLNLKMAQQNGVSRQEIIEALLHIAPYAGFPAAWEALAAADRVLDADGG